ncbi:hypothetical protein [Methanoregula sp.]|uniref:hypothetical protein n=1 Tax=Methanoregula sp. TaxID=2052170 RepID=UPI00356910A9
MKYKFAISVIILVCAALAFAGCTTPQGSTASPATTSGTAGATGAGALVTQPTDVIPDYNAVTVDVGEKDYLGKIPVTFQGGQGQISVKKIDVKLTRTDGTTQAATVGIKKGDNVELDGTRGTGSLQGQPDRVEVWVSMNNGQTYKVADVLREYRTRG